MTAQITLTLTLPPSVNNLFPQSRRGRRFPSPQYRRWREQAHWSILKADPPKLAGPYEVELLLQRPDKRRRDADNYFKGVLDALVHMHVLSDDSAIRKVSGEWVDQKGKAVTIIIRSLAS